MGGVSTTESGGSSVSTGGSSLGGDTEGDSGGDAGSLDMGLGESDSGTGGGDSLCGNGIVEGDEICDDGNIVDSDACTTLCAPPSCDDGIISGDEYGIDCGGSCRACALGDSCHSDEDCLTGSCSDNRCVYPESCVDVLELNPDAPDGEYTVDPDGQGGEDPFDLSCDMKTDGGGWIRLSLNHSQNLIVAEHSETNPWHKCADDSAKHFEWIAEENIDADYSPGEYSTNEEDLEYKNPESMAVYSPSQLDLIRGLISEMHASTRMVAVVSDDDHGGWENGKTLGHEVYILGMANNWVLLTPKENGQCGHSVGWPWPGTQSAYYRWNHSAVESVVDGQTDAVDNDLGGLDPGDLIPYKVELDTQSGGGVAFGWEKQVFLVR
ncbi:MAG TPA: hypothetical protein ENJ18_07920 [Nannocystis exedens]|nr:hypothetical protein [Nannocystis exedens]